MIESLKYKIRELLEKDEIQLIIDYDEFYFEKAKEALNNFLQLEVKEETKEFLLNNKKEYSELKQLFEDSQDLNEFGKAILTVISYCDSNAHKKREFNEYDDKRVLALAFVRMNNWVEQLITYKFGGQLADGSIKNAIDYLLNPLDNFTMLSENHRSQVAQNLFKNPYNKEKFKDDFFNFFSELSISVKNPENYTHLLSRLCYDNEVEKEWKDNIIGLICPDSTGWQEDAINNSKNGNHIALWNHKRPNGTTSTLKLLRQCIEENGFFRIFYTANYKVIYVAEIVDFVSNQKELDNANWPVNYGNIEWFNDIFSNYKDQNKIAKWIYLARKIFKVNSEDYLNFEYYKSNSYPSVGCQSPVVSYKNTLINNDSRMNKNIELLKYKKQIILQGPPGTGKTREAKLIAQEMIGLTPDIIKNKLVLGSKIANASGAKEYYTIKAINDDSVTLISDRTTQDWNPSYKEVIEKYNQLTKGIEPSNKNGMDPYSLAVAKHLNEFKFEELFEEQFKIIQFHPSYTYEDFVRGIISQPNPDGEGIIFKAENKTLGQFAKAALDNYKESKLSKTNSNQSASVFDAFIDGIKDELTQNENHKYDITEAVYLFSADETRFKYKGDNWVAHSKGLNMKFSELKKIIDSGASERQDIKKMNGIEELTRQHATYFIKIVEKYYEFKKTYIKSVPSKSNIDLKNYVLIIDEINRANLSSVLGELIYALEYRVEAVESMYAVDDDNQLILPQNLYIIGTMNTADRSVGHIDYAIRRRFAFVDVLPENLKEKQGLENFHEELFKAVEKLFKEYTSPEFEVKDVQLGHSYFIDKSEEENGAVMDIRFEYEIKPILLEYVKDGVLIGTDIKNKIEELQKLL